jgi:hypothetical protein
VVARRDDFVRTLTDRLLAYAIGRGTESYDWPAVRKIVRDSTAEDHRWSAIILGIVRSVPFGWSAGAEGAAEARLDPRATTMQPNSARRRSNRRTGT